MTSMENSTLNGSYTKMDNSTTASTSDTDEDGTDDLLVRARQNVVLCILGMVFNGTLLAVVCVSVRLRRSSKYQLIASLSLADVMLALIYLPLDTSMSLNGGVWLHSCHLMLFAYGLQEVVIPTIASLTLSALCLEYAVTMFYDDMTPLIKKRVVMFGVFVPWVAGFLALVPVFALRVLTASGSFTAACVNGTWSAASLTVLIGFFGYLPLSILVGSLLVMLASYICRPTLERMAVKTIVARSSGMYLTHELADTMFACLITLACNLPFLVEFCLHIQCDRGLNGNGDLTCRSPPRMQHVMEVLRTSESIFFPVVWMLGMEFRYGLFTSCRCCYVYCDVDMETQIQS